LFVPSTPLGPPRAAFSTDLDSITGTLRCARSRASTSGFRRSCVPSFSTCSTTPSSTIRMGTSPPAISDV